LTKALRKVHTGDIWLRRELIPSLIGSAHLDTHKAEVSSDCDMSLTKRESEVLSQIAAGHRNWKISSNLCISEATVKTHINSIYRKLAINNRLQATLYALKYNLMSR
jgi:DNA-binding NarL/FixJ family response regulator